MQSVLKVDMRENTVKPVLKVYHNPLMFGEKRCDLHPSVSYSKKHISIDTLYSGKERSVIILGGTV